MSDQTNIEWCDSTFNPWMGCTKVSPACDHCYAERDTKRFGRVEWGAGKPRVRTSPANWKLPERWNSKLYGQCRDCGWRGEYSGNGVFYCGSCGSDNVGEARRRVFSASLADWLDNEVPIEWLVDLLDLIRRTPNLDWLLLTKRIGNWWARLAEAAEYARALSIGLDDPLAAWMNGWYRGQPPLNVWLAITVVNQDEADRDVPKLLAVPATIRFLSIEPMRGTVNIGPWIPTCYECGATCGLRLSGMPKVERCQRCGEECGPDTEPVISEGCPQCSGELEPVCPDCGHYMVYQHPDTPCIDWIICGGESGPHARPMHPEWVRSLRDQCAAANVPFLFKQWGEWANEEAAGLKFDAGRKMFVLNSDGTQPEEIGEDSTDWECLSRFGKKAAGRLLDGRHHTEFPVVRP